MVPSKLRWIPWSKAIALHKVHPQRWVKVHLHHPLLDGRSLQMVLFTSEPGGPQDYGRLIVHAPKVWKRGLVNADGW